MALAMAFSSAAAFAAPGENVGGTGESVMWNVATLAPKRIGWSRNLDEIVIPFLNRETEGNLHLKVFWGGIMGDDSESLVKMRKGLLDGLGLSGRGATLLLPEMQVLQLPFMFRDYDEVDYVKSRMVGTFSRMLADRGVYMLGWIDQDFDQVYSIDKPYSGVEDFKGATIHTWFGAIEEEVIQALDARPLHLTVPESLPAARKKEFDVGMGPALWFVGAQLYSVFRYVNPMSIRYSPALVVVRMDSWQELPERYRGKIGAKRHEVMDLFSRKIRMDNEQALEAMSRYGLTVVYSTPEEIKGMRRVTRPIREELAGKEYPRSLLEELTGHLEEYRSAKH